MTLELAEALHRVGRLPREALPMLATELLAAGADTPALRRLAGMIGPELYEAAEYFARVLMELGRTGITKQEAFCRLALDLAGAVLAGSVARRTAADLGAEYARADGYGKLFLPLFLADDQYDCPCHGPAFADAEVARWAREILDATPEQAV